jgi:hypothetical protein
MQHVHRSFFVLPSGEPLLVHIWHTPEGSSDSQIDAIKVYDIGLDAVVGSCLQSLDSESLTENHRASALGVLRQDGVLL